MKTTRRTQPVRLAVIGTGRMGGNQVKVFKTIPGCVLVAAVDVDSRRAGAFAAEHDIPQVFPDTRSLLAAGVADAVTIVTPDPMHAPVALECLRAGVHVLCEKPLAQNHGDALRMVAAARRAGVVHMVNFSYRNWSALEGVARAVRAGKIGEIRHVEASYLQAWLASRIWGDWRTMPSWLWRLSTAHGSRGVLGDVGVHILDFATYPAGAIRRLTCTLKAFPKAPRNRIGEYRLDANDSAVLNVEFANGALGCIHTSRWVGGHINRLFLRISGTQGTVEIDSDRTKTGYRICAGRDLDTCGWKDVEVPEVPTNYARFIAAVRARKAVQPDFVRGAEIQKVIDACVESDRTGAWVRL